MFAVNPVIELVNEPVPEPSVVWPFDMVGLAVVAQHTPRAVTDVPPAEVTVPPDAAVVVVTADAAVVVTVGKAGVPLIATSSRQTPYPYFAFPSKAM